MIIHCLSVHPAIEFAAQELARYLQVIARTPAEFHTNGPRGNAPAAGFQLGLFDDFPGLNAPVVGDARLDDAIVIETGGERGIIAGSNPRSVLLAVYRYLRELGCRWVRPGPDGEYLPEVDLARTRVQVNEAASYRHRGVDLAGAISAEHLLAFIDWSPKLGFNSYFLEFDDCFGVCRLWYDHVGHPSRKPEPFTRADADALRLRVLSEIRKRGGVYHSKGHGWTVQCLGLPLDIGSRPTPEAVPLLAEVKGRREYIDGNPAFTNLCYSNPVARGKLVACVADFAQGHPETDCAHVWLADMPDNFCECEACRATRPADLYITLLNEIDAELTRRSLGTRIVFLAYLDLLWPPERNTLANPDRFIFMFAPISRRYDHSFAEALEESRLPAIPPFRYNRNELPKSIEENLAFLIAWRPHMPGDSFCFDYHYFMGPPMDLTGMHLARILSADIGAFKEMRLNGLIGCQTLRFNLPTGLGMVIMGETLWRRESTFDEILADHYQAAFGKEGETCVQFLQTLSGLMRRADRHYAGAEDHEISRLLEEMPGRIDQFLRVIERNQAAAQNQCHAASWRYLREHLLILQRLVLALAARARGDFKETGERIGETIRQIWECEDRAPLLLDGWLVTQKFRTRWLRRADAQTV